MAPPLRVTLDQAAKAELDRRYQTTRDATTRTRYQMILLRAEDHPVVEVAHLTRCSPDTVRRVLKRYLAGGADAVPHRPHLGQPPHYPPRWEAELVRVAELDPHQVGVDSVLWTCGLLADHLAEQTGHRAAARVNLSEADSFGNHCVVVVSSFGSLIQTAVGSAGGWGGLRTKRSGCSA